jgi:predicted ArsR family transcriptional regulator
MAQRPTPVASAITAVAALDDRLRLGLYEFIRRAGHPVTREEAAEAVGISRKLAAFHLDKLVATGLLQSGTGSALPRRVGRAPKVYQPVPDAVSVSIPTRAHDAIAAILIDAVVSKRPEESPEEARRRVASTQGRLRGEAADRGRLTGRLGVDRTLSLVESTLDDCGYEPFRDGPESIRMRNCPFHPLTARAPELVCGINASFLCGFLDGLGVDSVEAVLAPRPGECCVEVTPRRSR